MYLKDLQSLKIGSIGYLMNKEGKAVQGFWRTREGLVLTKRTSYEATDEITLNIDSSNFSETVRITPDGKIEKIINKSYDSRHGDEEIFIDLVEELFFMEKRTFIILETKNRGIILCFKDDDGEWTINNVNYKTEESVLRNLQVETEGKEIKGEAKTFIFGL